MFKDFRCCKECNSPPLLRQGSLNSESNPTYYYECPVCYNHAVTSLNDIFVSQSMDEAKSCWNTSNSTEYTGSLPFDKPINTINKGLISIPTELMLHYVRVSKEAHKAYFKTKMLLAIADDEFTPDSEMQKHCNIMGELNITATTNMEQAVEEFGYQQEYNQAQINWIDEGCSCMHELFMRLIVSKE